MLGNPLGYQRFEQRAVDRRHRQFGGFVGREPGPGLSFARLRAPSPSRAVVKNQDNRRIRIGTSIVGKSSRHHGARFQRQAELLGDLATQRNTRIFVGFHLSAREFPLPGMRFSRQRLLQEQATTLVSKNGGNNHKPCRISCQSVHSFERILNAELSDRFTGTNQGDRTP
jgi:hypothetical protein